MKKLLSILPMLMLGTILMAQDVADQNPRHAESRAKYAGKSDSLLANQGTTVHDTYKAFDWSQMREDHQYYRRENRNERRLERARAPRYYYSPWINRINTPLGWRNRPSFGYNAGNWNYWW